ncbi:hypothetical protein ACRWOO_11475 [Streptomyces sp. NEAU-PBA10]|uniref:hypothetical protein n=1 Tax=Streptomyces sp. NEAU-PBA10 TaxID=3438640 RepID=UPI003F7AA3C7
MTDTPDIPEPRVLSPRDEARVSFALQAEMIGKAAFDLLPVDPSAPHGDRLRRALALRADTDLLIEDAVIAEREEGATWTQIAEAAGTSKQAAHERWAGPVSAWAASGRAALPSGNHRTALDVARRLDEVYAKHDCGNPASDAVSSGLDAVRFPGAVAAEAARRERAAGLHARLTALRHQLTSLHEQHRLLSDGGARPQARAEVQARQSATYEEQAALYEELTAAEPELADEHRANAETGRAFAASTREYAELLAAKSEDEVAKGSA